jgi:hypothetical protein
MSKNESVENTELNEVLKETMNEILESDLEDVKLGKERFFLFRKRFSFSKRKGFSLNPHFEL